MKKLYTTPKYKNIHKSHLLKSEKKLHKKSVVTKRIRRELKKKREEHRIEETRNNHNTFSLHEFKPTVVAPSDLRLLENTEKCLSFFRDLRSDDYLSRKGLLKFVILSLKDVTKVDYGAISILTAIGDDLKYKGIILRSVLPNDPNSRDFMIESGYLNNLFDDNGKPFPKTEKSELIFFEKGCGRLSENDSIKISKLVKNVVGHLTGIEKYCLPIKTIILEICGNSIEWSGTENKQWLLGVKYDNEKVIFTVTDVGKGILDSLYRRFDKKLFEFYKSKDEILKGAFDKKYGSTTKEDNRNKGLPAVNSYFLNGIINNLKVLTNNVILHFDNNDFSREFKKGSPRFKGTFYQWEMQKDCLTKIITI